MAHRQHAVLDAVYYYRCRKWRGLQCWVAHDTLYKTTEPIMSRFGGKLWWAQETIIRSPQAGARRCFLLQSYFEQMLSWKKVAIGAEKNSAASVYL